jgi:hypothetical protein
MIDPHLSGPVKDEELEINPEPGMRIHIVKARCEWDTTAQ